MGRTDGRFSPQRIFFFFFLLLLKFTQVTVAHINATAKNAADDKLRQSLRRFANTHTAPATVVLVSSKCRNIYSFCNANHVGIIVEPEINEGQTCPQRGWHTYGLSDAFF